jgi:hypothetical protein
LGQDPWKSVFTMWVQRQTLRITNPESVIPCLSRNLFWFFRLPILPFCVVEVVRNRKSLSDSHKKDNSIIQDSSSWNWKVVCFQWGDSFETEMQDRAILKLRAVAHQWYWFELVFCVSFPVFVSSVVRTRTENHLFVSPPITLIT